VALVVRRTPLVGTAVGTVAVLAALTLTSCGFGGEPDDTSSGGQTASDAGDAGSGAGSGAGNTSAAAGSSRETRAQPAAGDLANFSCTQARGGVWSATGDVTNSAKEPMVYTVTVVTVDGSEISGEETEDLLLKPDEAVSFDLPTVASGSADACMPRLVRTPR
jgi:hypothetical protein